MWRKNTDTRRNYKTLFKELTNYESTYEKIIKLTGELYQVETRSYQGLNFKFHERFPTIVKGSLHKFWNSGRHNHNDFDYLSLCKTIARMEDELKINPNITVLNNLEFGNNIITTTNVSELINSIVAKGNFTRFDINGRDLKGFAEGIDFKTKSKK